MNNKTITLTQSQLVEAIQQYLPPGTKIEAVDFSMNTEGELAALVNLAERKTTGRHGDIDRAFQRRKKTRSDLNYAKTVTQRESFDCFTKERVKGKKPCIWIEEEGLTVAHPDRWPERVSSQLSKQDRKDIIAHLGLDRQQASAAADILGGSGGATDRGSALGGALEDV